MEYCKELTEKDKSLILAISKINDLFVLLMVISAFLFIIGASIIVLSIVNSHLIKLMAGIYALTLGHFLFASSQKNRKIYNLIQKLTEIIDRDAEN